MTSPVLDASAFVASISVHELQHQAARAALARVSPTTPFVVPELFRIEVMAALARRGESDALLDTVIAYLCTNRFVTVPMDARAADSAMQVARTARIRAYDAVYAALALDRGSPLLTFDRELTARLRAAYPAIQLLPDTP